MAQSETVESFLVEQKAELWSRWKSGAVVERGLGGPWTKHHVVVQHFCWRSHRGIAPAGA